jgi:hypothetical protein
MMRIVSSLRAVTGKKNHEEKAYIRGYLFSKLLSGKAKTAAFLRRILRKIMRCVSSGGAGLDAKMGLKMRLDATSFRWNA